MKISRFIRTFAPTALVALASILTGCTAMTPGDPCRDAMYDGTKMEPYADDAHKFRLCVPQHLTRTGPGGAADGQVVFSGFAVPAGTNLEAKTLIIVPGSYDELQGATPFGHFTAGGVTFKRVKLDDGSAGHSTLHVIYTWTMEGKSIHFDFTHRAVNPLVFDPGQRPKTYDQAAQVKLTEEIMGTFMRLPGA